MRVRTALLGALGTVAALHLAVDAFAQPAQPEPAPAPAPPAPAPGPPAPPGAPTQIPPPPDSAAPAPPPAPPAAPQPPAAPSDAAAPKDPAYPTDGGAEGPATYGGPAPPEAKGKPEPRTDLAPGQKREKQDYDGRTDVTTAGEDALWIPRIIFFPAYLVSEYVIRIPLKTLTIFVEENDIIAGAQALFTFGPNDSMQLLPTGFLDFGFRPSIGAVYSWNDAIARGNDFRANFGFGGIRFWKFGAVDRIPLVMPVGEERSRSYIQIEADYLSRADLLFWGIGPDVLDVDQSGYGITTYGGGGRVHVEPWRGTFFEGWVTSRYNRTSEGECSGDVAIDPFAEGSEGIRRGCEPDTLRRKIIDREQPPPPGYGRPYVTVKSGARVVLDSRDKRPAPGTGVALDVNLEHSADVDDPKLGSWLNYGAALAGFLDLTGKQRVLSLTLVARFLNPIDGYAVPFSEYIGVKRNEDVPDLELMKGFKPGMLIGRSATAATLEYRWPIWAFLDGTMQAAVGNVFAEPHLEDFRPELLRFSFIGGIRSPNHRDHSFNLLVGFGTKTFEAGGEPDSFRFLFGGTTGF